MLGMMWLKALCNRSYLNNRIFSPIMAETEPRALLGECPVIQVLSNKNFIKTVVVNE